MKFVYFGLLAVCLLTLFLRHRKLPAYCLWFLPIIALAIATELIKSYLVNDGEIVQRTYQVIECFLLLCFYNKLLRKPANKRLTIISYLVFLVLCLLYYVLIRKTFNVKDYFDFILEALIICIMVIVFLFELLDYKEDVNVLRYGAFWINAVHLIFYGGCFFAMAFYEQISKTNSPFGKELREIPHYLNLFLYAAYSIIFAFVKKN